jgi:hypothetical protein
MRVLFSPPFFGPAPEIWSWVFLRNSAPAGDSHKNRKPKTKNAFRNFSSKWLDF